MATENKDPTTEDVERWDNAVTEHLCGYMEQAAWEALGAASAGLRDMALLGVQAARMRKAITAALDMLGRDEVYAAAVELESALADVPPKSP